MNFHRIIFIIFGGYFGLSLKLYQNISCENLSTGSNLCISSYLALIIVIILGLTWLGSGINTFYLVKKTTLTQQKNTKVVDK